MITDKENGKTQKLSSGKSVYFSESFRKALLSKGWTLEKLSDETGIPIGTLGNYSTGLNLPRAENRKTLQKVLDLPDSVFIEPDKPRRVTRQSRLAGIEEAAKAGAFTTGNARIAEMLTNIRLVPVVSFAAAGRARSYEDPETCQRKQGLRRHPGAAIRGAICLSSMGNKAKEQEIKCQPERSFRFLQL